MGSRDDPYKVLGVGPDASEEQLRTAYHRLVQAHHPDHNSGSADSARRFEEIQEAYSSIRKLRAGRPIAGQTPPSTTTSADPDLEARLADLEHEVRRAHAARDRARRAAAQAARAEQERASDEELGYVTTDDTFAKILADAETELTERLAGARDHPTGRRVSELIDELAAKLKGDHSRDKSE